ncbi:hypothetical protein LshimejAT787_1900210 [Lyophyllum shimeji]|uniref:Uncharacterized protein n=1 Tax=Lyophyllum shimeji TaxID=47721 RepID=A0A9P3Q0K6_LYOSH|nr:hypothetical protein LshimejAT787_1900210 [Lyophyllum shimeji]
MQHSPLKYSRTPYRGLILWFIAQVLTGSLDFVVPTNTERFTSAPFCRTTHSSSVAVHLPPLLTTADLGTRFHDHDERCGCGGGLRKPLTPLGEATGSTSDGIPRPRHIKRLPTLQNFRASSVALLVVEYARSTSVLISRFRLSHSPTLRPPAERLNVSSNNGALRIPLTLSSGVSSVTVSSWWLDITDCFIS